MKHVLNSIRRAKPRFVAVAVIGTSLLIVGTQCSNAGPGLAAGDDTATLQAQLDALSPGSTLKLERRTYTHGGVIEIRVPDITIDGNGATIAATRDQTSAIHIDADGVSLSNVTLSAPLHGMRWHGLNQHKLVIDADDVSVSGVTISGSAAAGVFVTGASRFKLDHVTVRHSRADGIHITNGSNEGEVNFPRTEWTGDDGVAVVSYQNESPCQDIVVNSPVVVGTTWGRGLSVVGGHDISYRRISVAETNAAGVYIAAEGAPYFTHSTVNVDVIGGTVTDANTNPEIAQGAVLVYSANDGKEVSKVTAAGLEIVATARAARVNAAIAVDAGTVNAIAFGNFALRDTDLAPLYVSSKVPPGSFTLWGWTKDDKPISVP